MTHQSPRLRCPGDVSASVTAPASGAPGSGSWKTSLIVIRPIVPAAFRKLDALAVLTGPLLPAPACSARPGAATSPAALTLRLAVAVGAPGRRVAPRPLSLVFPPLLDIVACTFVCHRRSTARVVPSEVDIGLSPERRLALPGRLPAGAPAHDLCPGRQRCCAILSAFVPLELYSPRDAEGLARGQAIQRQPHTARSRSAPAPTMCGSRTKGQHPWPR